MSDKLHPNADFGAIVYAIGERIVYRPDEDAWQITVLNHPFFAAMLIEAKTVHALLDTELDDPAFIESEIRARKLEFGVVIGTAEVVEFPSVLGITPLLHEGGTRH